MQLYIFLLVVKVHYVTQDDYEIAINYIYLFVHTLFLPERGLSLHVDIKILLLLEQACVHSTIADRVGKSV